MAVDTYSPASHTTPTTATCAQAGNTQNVTGLSPGRVFTEMTDPWASATVWLPTGTTADGFPGVMLPFSTAGSVTVT